MTFLGIDATGWLILLSSPFVLWWFHRARVFENRVARPAPPVYAAAHGRFGAACDGCNVGSGIRGSSEHVRAAIERLGWLVVDRGGGLFPDTYCPPCKAKRLAPPVPKEKPMNMPIVQLACPACARAMETATQAVAADPKLAAMLAALGTKTPLRVFECPGCKAGAIVLTLPTSPGTLDDISRQMAAAAAPTTPTPAQAAPRPPT